MAANPGVSQARLNEIAARRLKALGIPFQPSPDGRNLQGELRFSPGKVLYPPTRAAVPKARFETEGHDKVRFCEPPLSSLPPVVFYDVASPAALEERVALALRVRMQTLEHLAGQLGRLQLGPQLDPERFALVATLRSTEQAFELTASPEGIRVSRVVDPRTASAFAVSSAFPALQLEQYASLLDLEFFLCQNVERMRQASAAPAKQPESEVLAALPAPEGALTLGALAKHFGPDAIVSPECALELLQEFSVHGVRHRFVARRQKGETFQGKVVNQTQERWSDRFNLKHFPGIESVVRTVLELPPAAAPDPGAASAAAASSGPLAAQPGEIWVMNIVVESDDGREVRYACVDVNGKPFGAARVLPREEFAGVFVQHHGGYRLLVQIQSVQADTVTYRQLDSSRQVRGSQRTIPVGVLVSNFIAEAAAY